MWFMPMLMVVVRVLVELEVMVSTPRLEVLAAGTEMTGWVMIVLTTSGDEM